MDRLDSGLEVVSSLAGPLSGVGFFILESFDRARVLWNRTARQSEPDFSWHDCTYSRSQEWNGEKVRPTHSEA